MILARLVSEPILDVAIPDAATWRRVRVTAADTAEEALLGGFQADRPAWVIASGYFAATRRLAPGVPIGACAAMCATEQGPGVHPARIATTFADGRVTGTKSFVTLGEQADRLLVLASAGRDGDRNRLVLVDVDARDARFGALPPMPFVPELGHATATFDQAPGTALSGDGWADYVRPFRTIEDVHVHLALVGWLVRVGRTADLGAVERGLALAVAGLDLAKADPSAAITHLAVAGWLDLVGELATTFPWERAAPAIGAAWARDRRMLDIAKGAREARRAQARAAFPS